MQYCILNCVLFLDDIILKQHAGKPWKNLTLKQLLNSQYTSVTLNLKHLKFTRKCLHTVLRYVIYAADYKPNIQRDTTSHTTLADGNSARIIYTHSFIKAYTQELMKCARQLVPVIIII